MWGQEKSWPFCVAVLKVGPPKETVSSDEGMLAGGDCIANDCTPAKPLWSEVIIFWDVLLRREYRCPEMRVAPIILEFLLL